MSSNPLPLDTGVLITLAAATGSWSVLNAFACPIMVTRTVMDEIRCCPKGNPGVDPPLAACMSIWDQEYKITPWLLGVLDQGEASVIALAFTQRWPEVVIDESVGRLVAKTSRLRSTGSLGLVIRAKRKGYPIIIAEAIARIQTTGNWVGAEVEQPSLTHRRRGMMTVSESILSSARDAGLIP